MTLYELIRKIGDGVAPTKIKLFGENFTYNEVDKDYINEKGDKLLEDYYWQEDLDTEVEDICYVLKSTNCNFSYQTPHKIKKMVVDNGRLSSETTGNYCYTLRQIDKILIKKINELIDEVILLIDEKEKRNNK